MTTLEKIDAMLAWLDEGTPGPWRFVPESCEDFPFIEAPALSDECPFAVADLNFGETVSPATEAENIANGRNIAALLNSSRDELVKLRDLLEVAERDPSMVSAGVKIVTEAIVDIRYKAFEEARNG